MDRADLAKRLQNDAFVRTLMSITILGISCALVSLLSLASLDRRFAWARYAVHATVWPLTAYLILMSWNPNLVDQQLSGRIMGVLGIAVASLTVLTPVLHKLSSNETDDIDSEIVKLKRRIAELEEKRANMSIRTEDE